jgi:hypothetical protein
VQTGGQAELSGNGSPHGKCRQDKSGPAPSGCQEPTQTAARIQACWSPAPRQLQGHAQPGVASYVLPVHEPFHMTPYHKLHGCVHFPVTVTMNSGWQQDRTHCCNACAITTWGSNLAAKETELCGEAATLLDGIGKRACFELPAPHRPAMRAAAALNQFLFACLPLLPASCRSLRSSEQPRELPPDTSSLLLVTALR